MQEFEYSKYFFLFFYRAKLTPVHIAAEEGTLHILASLLQAGADPNIKDIKGIYFLNILMFFNFLFIDHNLIMLLEK